MDGRVSRNEVKLLTPVLFVEIWERNISTNWRKRGDNIVFSRHVRLALILCETILKRGNEVEHEAKIFDVDQSRSFVVFEGC